MALCQDSDRFTIVAESLDPQTKCGSVFYYKADKSPVTDEKLLTHLKRIRVPISYQHVEYNENICSTHLARGRDRQKNLQYIRTKQAKQNARTEKLVAVITFLGGMKEFRAFILKKLNESVVGTLSYTTACMLLLMCHVNVHIYSKVRDEKMNILRLPRLHILFSPPEQHTITLQHSNNALEIINAELYSIMKAQHDIVPSERVCFFGYMVRKRWTHVRYRDVEEVMKAINPTFTLNLFKFYHGDMAFLRALVDEHIKADRSIPNWADRVVNRADRTAAKAIDTSVDSYRLTYKCPTIAAHYKEKPEQYVLKIGRLFNSSDPASSIAAVRQLHLQESESRKAN